jgi:ectoine hydroxylase-related dioxygenase (phytanoyl-CoA dioxygenase family)
MRSNAWSLRTSRLIFTGGLIHAGGENTTQAIRKSVLTGYQLGWLRPENKFHAYKPLHDALINGLFSVRDSDRTATTFR